MAAVQNTCELCGEPAGPRSARCKPCQSAGYRWASKRPAQIIERRRKLELYSYRLDADFNEVLKPAKRQWEMK